MNVGAVLYMQVGSEVWDQTAAYGGFTQRSDDRYNMLSHSLSAHMAISSHCTSCSLLHESHAPASVWAVSASQISTQMM